ncbi:MAG: AraC family transcriptional regulator [Verrucomicrobiota bacterium]
MKLRFEKISLQENHSIQVIALRKNEFDAPWHFHPEWELTLIQEGHGKRFVGNSIEPFQKGDLVLLGPDLPHFWHSEPSSKSRNTHSARAVVVQFPDTFPGSEFLKLPELDRVRALLQKGKNGLVFSGTETKKAVALLEALPPQAPLDRLLGLISTLHFLSKSESRPLSQSPYTNQTEFESSTRLGKAYTYLLAHYQNPLSLDEIAQAAAMTPAAFSRFFKRMTNRNIWDLLNDLRVDHATRLLRETQTDITAIAYESGFGTLSSFNRHFLRVHKKTPSRYRKETTLASP